ncbi:Neuropeptide-like 1 [Harpegnathos saltator]|uniref:Neuropeptide-like 1 n=1 Tax=Harpegnathos saltator TaxID=610380 RepID=E2B8N0_HARSA|nr:Neuropeptide-like 1 [Harpegnathos saltator]
MVHLKALSSEESDDAEICIPSGVYLELFRDPALRGHLSVMARTHKLPEFPGRLLDDSEEIEPRDVISELEKRSLATLAKNDDLPVTIQERRSDRDDEEKRSHFSDNRGALISALLAEEYRRRVPEYYDFLSELDPEVDEYTLDKRNVGSLARDFALPTGRRHIASVARDYGLPSGKRNIGALARQSMLPLNGKRNVASLARYYMLPQADKRNVAALARESSLPYGKRYLGSLARSGGYPVYGYDDGKRSVASLARNADWPAFAKRGRSTPGRIMATMRVLNRHGRSLNDDREARNNEPLDLQQLIRQGHHGDEEAKEDVAEWQTTPFSVLDELEDTKAKNRSNRKMDVASQTRHKRQIDFSDEYPLPVVQNANVFDYEDMIDAFADHYPNAEKRFMACCELWTLSGTGSVPEMPADSGYPEVLRTKKEAVFRDITKARMMNFRENPADGSTSHYTSDTSTRSLRPLFTPKTRYLQSLHGDCRHGFKRFLLLPDVDDFLRPNSRIAPRSM